MEKPRTIDEYILNFPDEIRELLQTVRFAIHAAVPDAPEAIRYGMPAIKTGDHWLYFCAYKKHIGFYPIYDLETIESLLEPYRAKKAEHTLHFFYNQPIPVELIGTIARLRVQTPVTGSSKH